MLLPTPADLRAALSRYADAVIEDERRSTPESVRRREDTAYTLCVMTGVSEVREALSRADALLDREFPAEEPGRADHSGAVPV
ncbi:DUF5133 domain-containing protein [Streptomyces sp. NBC_00525]|uniref:DUF5133 domain-containing protein n=1 Tax=Streptomyces sp. NBC_00525 TaxID=2903660 RepID=UPI002E812110|nr:DUF5133 domain-containing protein [Streptomyces sp. NBC_00525]WUC97478.1 DUF5133 domain-containing protein [Streptomyces sp. NBC_00525]